MRFGSLLHSRLLQRGLHGLLAVLALQGLALAQGSSPKGNELSVGGLIVASGFIGWVIIALSVLGLTLVIEAWVTLKREKLAPPEMIDEVQALFDEGEYQEAMTLCEEDPNFFSRVTGAGLAKVGHGFDVMETAMSEMGDEESIKLHQKIGYIALVANVAPMLGLLGTVQGMIVTFNQIAASGGQASPAELANGISIALLTTLFGLLVAIPMTAAFAYLRNRLVRSVIEVGAIIEDLFERFREKGA
jgi:biopolymer transport protein ExbB